MHCVELIHHVDILHAVCGFYMSRRSKHVLCSVLGSAVCVFSNARKLSFWL